MTYFISDIHLGLQERKLDKIREDTLLSFLDKIKPNCKKIFIVGDLFDYWFEYKSVIPKNYYRTLTKLEELNRIGIRVVYLMGNHDFGHLDFFEDELNIKIFNDDIEETINGKRFYISHGDGKANNDEGYRAIKKILRSRWANKMFRSIHPDLGIKLAHSSSKKSRYYTDGKSYGESEGLEDFAAAKISEGFDYVIMGHRHRLVKKQIGNGFYINLGDWIKEPYFGLFDGSEFALLKVNDFISS